MSYSPLGPSLNQSLENYDHFIDEMREETREEMLSRNTFKVTHVNVIDRLLKKELINSEFHRSKLKECILADKREETKDLFYSMIIAGTAITTFLIFIFPSDKYYIFKFLYLFYISIVYLLASLFYRKLV